MKALIAVGIAVLAANTDGDLVGDGVEVLRLNSNPLSANSDGAIWVDGKERASVNSDYTVGAGDLGEIASKFGNSYGPSNRQKRNLDFNRDGNITSGDLGNAASQFGAC